MSGGLTPLFGGAGATPSVTSYAAYSVATGATLTLAWPFGFLAQPNNVAAQWMDITAAGAGCVVQLPPANAGSPGYPLTINNAGSTTFSVTDASGAYVCAIKPGVVITLLLINNTTVAGTWRIITLGSTPAGPVASVLAGNGLFATSGNQLGWGPNAVVLTADYFVTSADYAKVFIWEGTSGALVLPEASASGTQFIIGLKNEGTGSWTIGASGSGGIDGSTTLVLRQEVAASSSVTEPSGCHCVSSTPAPTTTPRLPPRLM